jgi:hypothetical protein
MELRPSVRRSKDYVSAPIYCAICVNASPVNMGSLRPRTLQIEPHQARQDAEPWHGIHPKHQTVLCAWMGHDGVRQHVTMNDQDGT